MFNDLLFLQDDEDIQEDNMKLKVFYQKNTNLFLKSSADVLPPHRQDLIRN